MVETIRKTTENRYDAIDGLRAYSAIGIVLMHVLANGNYSVSGFVFDRLIPSFTDLTFLFMVVSGFAMCRGYYDKIINGKIDGSSVLPRITPTPQPITAPLPE